MNKREKLTLNRETLCSLDRRQLAEVAGGATGRRCGDFTKLAGTCLSCDGPNSCKSECITTVPI